MKGFHMYLRLNTRGHVTSGVSSLTFLHDLGVCSDAGPGCGHAAHLPFEQQVEVQGNQCTGESSSHNVFGCGGAQGAVYVYMCVRVNEQLMRAIRNSTCTQAPSATLADKDRRRP